MSSTLKHLRIHCNRWLIYSNELKFAFFYHIKITVIVELTDGQSLTDCSLLEGKRNITPLISGGHAWPCSSSFRSFSPFISSSGILSLSLSLSLFFFCSVSSSLLLWSLLEINRNFNLNARSFHTSYSFNNESFFLYFFSKRVQSQLT